MDRTKPSVDLRVWQESDLPMLMRLRNDVGLQAQLLATARGSDMNAVRAWLARRTEGKGRIFRIIADPANDDPVGYLQAELLDDQPQTWRFGICLDEPFQGAGRGTAALMALENELVQDFGARCLTLEVDRSNERAIRCYQGLGYLKDSMAARQVMVRDQSREAITMAKPIAPGGARS